MHEALRVLPDAVTRLPKLGRWDETLGIAWEAKDAASMPGDAMRGSYWSKADSVDCLVECRFDEVHHRDAQLVAHGAQNGDVRCMEMEMRCVEYG